MNCQVPKGLYVTDNFITPNQCTAILNFIDSPVNNWSSDIERRTQHYGARYDYKTRKLIYDVAPVAAIQPAIACLTPNFAYLSPTHPHIQQVIINEYIGKQRITKHTDSGYFGPVVMTLTLGDSTPMVMTHPQYGTYTINTDNGTCILLSDEARYAWTHETLPMSSGSRRVSVTVRSIL